MHEAIVSLQERFADLLRRYGAVDRQLAGRIGETSRRMAGIEERIFSLLPYSPAALFRW